MDRSILHPVRSLVRSAAVLGLVGAAAFGLLDGAGTAGAQSVAATPAAPTATATPASTATAAATTTAMAAASSAFAAGQTVVVNVDTLNFRADASIDSTVTSQLLDGTWAAVVSGPVDAGDGYAWYRIDVDGATGWVDGSYLADASSEAATLPVGTTVIVTSDSLNLRSDPSLSGTVEATLSNGDIATVVAASQIADGYIWQQVDVNGVTGWAARDSLAFAPSNISTVAAGAGAVVNTDVLVLRGAPSTSGAKLADLAGGTILTIVSGPTAGGDGDWFQVSDGTSTGWVAADYLRVA